MSVGAIEFEDDFSYPVEPVSLFASKEVKPTDYLASLPRTFRKTASSISKAAPVASTLPTSRPALEKPKAKNAIHNLADFQLDLEETTAKVNKVTSDDLRQTLAEMDRITAMRREAVEKEAQAIQSRNTWGTLAHVANYVLSIASILSGNPLLMAAGVIGVTTRVGHDTGFINAAASWMTESAELQQKLIKGIDALSVSLQIALSLSGVVMAWNAGTFATGATPLTFIKKTSSALGTAGGIASIAAQVGTSVYQNKVTKLRANIKEMEGKVAMQQQDEIPRNTQKMIQMTEFTGSEAKDLSRTINSNYG